MYMNNTGLIIEQTQKWIREVVIGYNFCPFAAREVKRNAVHYEVTYGDQLSVCLKAFMKECERLDQNPSVETSLLILPDSVPVFEDYLALVAMAEKAVKKNGYEGVYQVAGFHPLYRFAGSYALDAANYTNRSPYSMLHLLREASIEKVLEKYPNPEGIPERNIRFAREKGVACMEMLWRSCRQSTPAADNL